MSADPGWHIEVRGAPPAWEVTAFTDAGTQEMAQHCGPAALPFAPRRWLLIGAARDVPQALGSKVEVTGKWHGLAITGPRSTRLIASAIDIETLLHARRCAAVTLFDCPCIVAKLGEAGMPGFLVWVQASYCEHFCAVVRALRIV